MHPLRAAILVAAVALACVSAEFRNATLAPLIAAADSSLVIPERYIVVLKKEHKDAVSIDTFIAQHLFWLSGLITLRRRTGGEPPGGGVEHRYELPGMAGYAGRFSEDVIAQIRMRPEVRYIEQDQVVYTAGIESALENVRLRARLVASFVATLKRADVLRMASMSPHDARPELAAFNRLSPMPSFLVNTGPDAPLHRRPHRPHRPHRPTGAPGKPPVSTTTAKTTTAHTTTTGGPQPSTGVLVQSDAPWGISRLSAGGAGSGSTYTYPASAGRGVDVYVIDTGINVAHVDFEGRAIWGQTIPFGDEDVDGNGHGTHVAGTVASKTYGVAKAARVHAVKVLRTSGFGTNADVIKGVEWALGAAQAAARPSVANMSLGGGLSQALDDAVEKAIAGGVHFAVAAGNDGEDACDYSPAGAKGTVSVAASDSSDALAYFSNVGACVSVIAPGVDILSTYIGSDTATTSMSGTSMASPHVAGLLALYLGTRPDWKPADLKAQVIADAIASSVSGVPSPTPNLLVTSRKLMHL